jgi:hypothetical protein
VTRLSVVVLLLAGLVAGATGWGRAAAAADPVKVVYHVYLRP